MAVSDWSPRYVENNPSLGRVGFADGYPLLVTSQSSIEKLNEYLESVGKPRIPADRFRANIILDGLEAFEEDTIDTLTFAARGIAMTLQRMKACGRCPIPDTDQLTGARKTYVRSALGKIGRTGVHQDSIKYGDKPEIFFGQNFVIKMPKHDMMQYETLPLVRGQTVTDITYADSPNWVPAQ